MPTEIETECTLCQSVLFRKNVRRNVPDFCIPCYMAKIHPKVEEAIRNTPTGQRIPEHCELVKQVLSLMK